MTTHLSVPEVPTPAQPRQPALLGRGRDQVQRPDPRREQQPDRETLRGLRLPGDPRGLHTGTGTRGGGWRVLGALPEHQPFPLPATRPVPVRVWEQRCCSCPTPLWRQQHPRGSVARSRSEAGTAPGPCAGDVTLPGLLGTGQGRREVSRAGGCPAARSLVATSAALPTPQNATFVLSRGHGQLWPGRSVEPQGGHGTVTPRMDPGRHLRA